MKHSLAVFAFFALMASAAHAQQITGASTPNFGLTLTSQINLAPPNMAQLDPAQIERANTPMTAATAAALEPSAGGNTAEVSPVDYANQELQKIGVLASPTAPAAQ